MTNRIVPEAKEAEALLQAEKRLQAVRRLFPRPRCLTLAEKILFSHLHPRFLKNKSFQGEEDFLFLQPDRVIMQDATAQTALLQFMLAGKDRSLAPASVHCDHLILAKDGLKKDMTAALSSNKEVFDFLKTAAGRYNIDFWKPGSGIIHQTVLENYAVPGALIVGTDSHTPNAGGLGALAIGVGGADAVDAMAGLPWELPRPQIIGVHLTGALKGWASPKDVILKLLGVLTVKGGTNKIIEYFGPGAASLSCTGKAAIANMGAETGATSSVFPFDSSMAAYLKACGREETARLAERRRRLLQADPEVLKSPEDFYSQVIKIDLDSLEPHIAGPHTPDRVRSVREMKREALEEGWPTALSAALIGSCTNSSYEDIGRAAAVARQARRAGLKMPQPFLVTPGSERIKQTIERDGYMEELEQTGALVLANACGPCIGQWSRPLKKGEPNTILNSFNRNFRGRNDGSGDTLSFIAGPEIVMAAGLAGRLDFDPETDAIERSGRKIRLDPPEAAALPEEGFALGLEGFCKPTGKGTVIQIKAHSDRVRRLQPFPPWDGKDFENVIPLCKARGKCTTDHICPAGIWLKYRGCLDKISDNLLMGALNDWTGERGRGRNQLTGETEPFAVTARHYLKAGRAWAIIGDENYGEGSSREHAAMTPRHLGAKIIVAKSFARIHETNLKRQGVLPLVFENPEDYKLIQEESLLSLAGLKNLQPKSLLRLKVMGAAASAKAAAAQQQTAEIPVRHSLSQEQIEWFKAGSSLNFIRQNN